MAVNVTDSGKVPSMNANAAPQANQSFEQPKGGNPMGATGPMALAMFHSRPVGRTGAGELVSKFTKALTDKIAALGYADQYEILTMDARQQLTHYSSVLFCLKKPTAQGLIVGVHAMILEGSGARQNPRYENIGGQSVERLLVAGDSATQKFWQKIEVLVRSTFGGQVTVVNAGVEVVPEEASPDSDHFINQLYYYGSNATIGCLNNALQLERPFTAKVVADAGVNVTARIDFNPPAHATAAGLPIRSDLDIVLAANALGNDPQECEQTIEITSVSAYVDLVYVGAPQQQQPQQWGAPIQQPNQTQQYRPRLVMTSLASQLAGITPELQLTALSTAILAAENHAWTGVFAERYLTPGRAERKTSVDLHDIGAVGYEIAFQPGQAPQAIDTKSNSFDANARFQFLNSIFQPGLFYSMIVNETDELSWVNSAFLAAANGVMEATADIIASADRLTGGVFSKKWDASQQIAIDGGRVHCGYYVDENGDRKDIRDIDYLAILNLMGAKNPTAIVDWSQTFDAVNIQEEIRLEKRWKMLELVLGDSLRLTGYGRLLTFNPAFLTTLADAIAATLKFNKGNLVRQFTGFQRGNAALNNFAYIPTQSNLFTNTTVNQNTGTRFGINMGRWG